MIPAPNPTPTIPPDRWEDWNRLALQKRQEPSGPIAYPDCSFVSPNVQSCYPTDETVVFQNQWTRFIWNTRYTLFVGDDGEGDVTIILRNAETDLQVGNWTLENKLGRYSIAVNDDWWDARAVTEWRGEPRMWTFYWQIIPSTHTINGGEERQPTFTVVQTALPNSYLSSTSASLVAESMASVSRSLALEVSAAQQSRDAALQAGRNNNNFPSWAIALIVILGLISIVSVLTLFFVVLRSSRRRRSLQKRSSMGSESPMMQAPGAPLSPAAASVTGIAAAPPVRNAPSIRYNETNSVVSRANSATEGVITGSDAAIMADAFRKALRKPDFADGPQEEGESPEQNGETEGLLMNRELAEEGKNIRSVSSERGVRVVADDSSPK